MLNRRRFIESSVAGSLAGALATWDLAAAAGPGVACPYSAAPRSAIGPAPHREELHAVLFDERFTEAVRFGRAAGRAGLPTRRVGGDITDLYAELHPLWKRRAVPIAGVTAYAALFCLERLAWDHGMRIVHHGTHGASGDPGDWPAQVASMMARTAACSKWSGRPPAEQAACGPGGKAVHSWVIATPVRA